MESIEKPGFKQHRYQLNRFQVLGDFHPFTCAHGGSHPDYGVLDKGVLIATDDGWRCPHCDYQQDWAHAVMSGEPQSFALLRNPEMEEHWERLADELGDRLCRIVIALDRMRQEAKHPEVVEILLEDVRAMGDELRSLRRGP